MARPKQGPAEYVVVIVSDATGSTGEHSVNRALAQFEEAASVRIEKRPRVRTARQVDKVVDEAEQIGAMIVHTLASTQLRRRIHVRARERRVQIVDLFGNLLSGLTHFLGHRPEGKPGGIQTGGVDEDYYRDYYKRVEAITFAVKHDDGLGLRDLRGADIVLVGVSRTSKTPLSIFLAARGYLVANIPIMPGIEPPAELQSIDQRKVVGLRMDPERLSEVRESRLKPYRSDVRRAYQSANHVHQEVTFADTLFRSRGWPVVDVTMKSLEEAATEVVSLARLPRFRPGDRLR